MFFFRLSSFSPARVASAWEPLGGKRGGPSQLDPGPNGGAPLYQPRTGRGKEDWDQYIQAGSFWEEKKSPPRPHSFSPIPFYISNHPLNHAISSPGRRLKLPKPRRPVEGSSPHLTSPAPSSSCLASAPTLSVPGVLASTHAASATKPLATRAASSAVGAHNWRLSPTAIVDTAHPGDVRARTLQLHHLLRLFLRLPLHLHLYLHLHLHLSPLPGFTRP